VRSAETGGRERGDGGGQTVQITPQGNNAARLVEVIRCAIKRERDREYSCRGQREEEKEDV
jgi:hypothetical protein